MDPRLILALFLKAFAIWLVVIGIVQMPSVIGSLVSYWPDTEVTGYTVKAQLVGRVVTEALRIAAGCFLLVAAEGLAVRLCRAPRSEDLAVNTDSN